MILEQEYSCSDHCCLNWSSDECNSSNERHFKNYVKLKHQAKEEKELNQFNKNCGRFNGQPWIKSKCPTDKAIPKAEEITMINTSKPNDSTFRKSASGTVKSITECINSGQLGDLTLNDQTDDSGKETASESSEPTGNLNGNLNKSSFDLNCSQSSSSYSTENEDCSIKKDSSIDKNGFGNRKECCANKSKRDGKSHLRKEKTNLNEPFYLHHSSIDQKNEKSKKQFPKTNLSKLDRVNGKLATEKMCRNDHPANDLPDAETGAVAEVTKQFNTLDKGGCKLKEANEKANEKPNLKAERNEKPEMNKSATFTSKSIRIFEANKVEQQKANKIIRLNEEKPDELDQVKLKDHATCHPASPAKEISPPESSEESPIDSRIANKDEAKEKVAEQTDDTTANKSMAIPVPPPMPGESLKTSVGPILIKTNRTASVEKPALNQTLKITFIPPQFSAPPETDTNLKPSEYLKKVAVAKSYTVDNFKNMKKVRLAQQRFKGGAEESPGDSIKRSSSENHLLVNARKEKLNQSISSNNVRNEEDDDSNDPDLQQLDDDTEDELAEHQYEISKPSAVELKLQLDKQLISSNLSRRSSIKLKLSVLEQEQDEEKEEEKSVQSSSTSSTISGSTISSSTISGSTVSSTVASSFGVTEEQLKTIFLKKTPVKKPETKTFSSAGKGS